MRIMLTLSLLLSVLLSSMAVADTVYRWVDEHGKVHYSDTPVKNAEVFDSKDNTHNEVKVNHGTISSTDAEPEAPIPYQVSIISPKEDATLRDNNGEFSATVAVSPKAPKGALLQLLLDGNPYGQAQSSNTFKLKRVDRGEHQLMIQLLTQNGKLLASSPSRRVFLHQANIRPQAKPKAK